MATFKITHIERWFGSSETVEAVIRNANKDEHITGGLLATLMESFNTLNGAEVPRMGYPYKIPVIQRNLK